MTAEARLCAFDANVDRSGDCWLWKGKTDARGYGLLYITKQRFRAHRLAWQLFKGPIPDGMFVCHRCDNPPCCNPDHLFVGTHDDNMRDCIAKRRHVHLKKTHCKQGHPYAGDNLIIKVNAATSHPYRMCRACRDRWNAMRRKHV